MEEQDPQKRRPIAQCSCGALLCPSSVIGHVVQGHSTSSLVQKSNLDEALDAISQKKREVLEVSQRIISEVEKMTSSQLSKLKALKKEAAELFSMNASNLDCIKQKLNGFGLYEEYTSQLSKFLQGLANDPKKTEKRNLRSRDVYYSRASKYSSSSESPLNSEYLEPLKSQKKVVKPKYSSFKYPTSPPIFEYLGDPGESYRSSDYYSSYSSGSD